MLNSGFSRWHLLTTQVRRAAFTDPMLTNIPATIVIRQHVQIHPSQSTIPHMTPCQAFSGECALHLPVLLFPSDLHWSHASVLCTIDQLYMVADKTVRWPNERFECSCLLPSFLLFTGGVLNGTWLSQLPIQLVNGERKATSKHTIDQLQMPF